MTGRISGLFNRLFRRNKQVSNPNVIDVTENFNKNKITKEAKDNSDEGKKLIADRSRSVKNSPMGSNRIWDNTEREWFFYDLSSPPTVNIDDYDFANINIDSDGNSVTVWVKKEYKSSISDRDQSLAPNVDNFDLNQGISS